jgi:hypothetical protein
MTGVNSLSFIPFFMFTFSYRSELLCRPSAQAVAWESEQICSMTVRDCSSGHSRDVNRSFRLIGFDYRAYDGQVVVFQRAVRKIVVPMLPNSVSYTPLNFSRGAQGLLAK